MNYFKIMMMALMMCFVNVSYSQVSDTSDFSKVKFQKIYLGNLFAGYKNCYFKFDTSSTGGVSQTLYNDFKFASLDYSGNVAYPSGRNSETISDSIKEKIFKVELILDKNGNETNKVEYHSKPIFKLRNIKNNEILYYKFNTEYSHNFIFLATEPNIENSIIDQKISKSFDEIENETTYYTPYDIDISITRINKAGVNTYYLSLEVIGSTLNYNISGVTILFTDGTKWSRPNEKVDIDYKNGNYVYSSFVKLTKEDLKTFQTKSIKKYKLYIYDNNNFSDGFILKKYAQRIDKIK